jgi:hypothetical protein
MLNMQIVKVYNDFHKARTPKNVGAAFNDTDISVVVDGGWRPNMLDHPSANRVRDYQAFPDKYPPHHHLIKPELARVLTAISQPDEIMDFDDLEQISDEELEGIRLRIEQEYG